MQKLTLMKSTNPANYCPVDFGRNTLMLVAAPYELKTRDAHFFSDKDGRFVTLPERP